VIPGLARDEMHRLVDVHGGDYRHSRLAIFSRYATEECPYVGRNRSLPPSGFKAANGGCGRAAFDLIGPAPAIWTGVGGTTFCSPNGSCSTLGGPPGGVPEPASWAMMLLGFGAIGGALRSRKVTVRFA